MRHRILGLTIVLMAVAAMPAPAAACTCVGNGPPCQDFWSAEAVFVGRVVSVESMPASSAFLRDRRVTLEVSEAFRGAQPGRVIVHTGRGGGDCGYPFRVGADYVVYAGTREGVLTADICSRTAPIDKAAADLAYGRALAGGQAFAGGVSGTAMLAPATLGGQPTANRPMPGLTFTVAGAAGEQRVVADDRGRFTLTGLAPGDYRVSAEAPDGYFVDVFPASVTLEDPRACADVNAVVRHDGRVAGRVIDARGQPVPGLTLELLAATDLAGERPGSRYRALTGDDGRYELNHLPPGRFVVAINPASRGAALDGPSAYYPGVLEPARATVTTLARGGRVALGDFVVPPPIELMPIHGTVRGPDGVPVEGAKVYLKTADESRFIITEPAVTRVDGTFVLAGAIGASYQVIAEHWVTGGGQRRFIAAEPVSVVVTPGMSALTLTLRPQF